MPLILRAIAYLCIGITAEIAFTGIKSLIKKDWTGHAHTTIWMFPIYALGLPFIFEPLHNAIIDWHILIRAVIYGVGILIAEYIMATVYKWIIGKNPWEYTKGWHLHGKVRLDYFPLWAGFGLLLELLHNFLISI